MMMNKQFLIEEFQELITCGGFYYGPINILTIEQHPLCDCQLHHYCSIFNIPQEKIINFISNVKKRKRNQQEDLEIDASNRC